MLALSPIVNHLGHASDELETHRIRLLEIGAGIYFQSANYNRNMLEAQCNGPEISCLMLNLGKPHLKELFASAQKITCEFISVALSNLTSGKSQPSRSLSPISSSITTTYELASLFLSIIPQD